MASPGAVTLVNLVARVAQSTSEISDIDASGSSVRIANSDLRFSGDGTGTRIFGEDGVRISNTYLAASQSNMGIGSEFGRVEWANGAQASQLVLHNADFNATSNDSGLDLQRLNLEARAGSTASFVAKSEVIWQNGRSVIDSSSLSVSSSGSIALRNNQVAGQQGNLVFNSDTGWRWWIQALTDRVGLA